MIPDRKLAAKDVRIGPGGGGINVARVVTRLGGSVLGLWSSGGTTGQLLSRLLDEEGVTHEAVAIGREIRENVMVRDESTAQQFRFGMPGPDIDADGRRAWDERIRALGQTADLQYVVFSGSVPEAVSPAWYAQLLATVPAGVRLIVDTKAAALEQALHHGVFLVKPNVRELEDVLGFSFSDDSDIEEAARGVIRDGGAQAVLVSLGGAGALLVTADVAHRITAPAVRLVSKVGAGDSMLGAVVAALSDGKDLLEAARRGVAAGAAAVATPGTELCAREQVERLLNSMKYAA